MHLLDLPHESPSSEIIMIELVPRGQSCELWTWEFGEWTDIEAVYGACDEVENTEHRSPYCELVGQIRKNHGGEAMNEDVACILEKAICIQLKWRDQSIGGKQYCRSPSTFRMIHAR